MKLVKICLIVCVGFLVFEPLLMAQRIDSQVLLWREIGKLADAELVTRGQALQMFRMAFPKAASLPDGTPFNAEPELPRLSEKIDLLNVRNLRSSGVGEVIDPVALAGDDYHLVFVVRKARALGRFVGRLGKRLDQIEAESDQAWAMSWLVLGDHSELSAKVFHRMERTFPESMVAGLAEDEGEDSVDNRSEAMARVYITRGERLLRELSFETDSTGAYERILRAVDSVMVQQAPSRLP